jgi:hypothetical protein
LRGGERSQPAAEASGQVEADTAPQSVKKTKRKKRRGSSNPFIQAAIQCDEEGGLSGGDSGYDSLEVSLSGA